jgi:hypothetical protein
MRQPWIAEHLLADRPAIGSPSGPAEEDRQAADDEQATKRKVRV